MAKTIKIIKKLFPLIICAAIMMSCKGRQQPTPEYDVQESTEKLMSIDDICKVEDIIADSSLMNAQGDTAWRKINDQLVRIKMGSNYYLRKETKDGYVTNFTYRYD